MSLFKLTGATAAALLVITPTVASAGTRAAEAVPVAAKKAATPAKGKAGYIRVKPKEETASGQAAGGSGLVIGGLAVAAIIGAVIIVADSDS